MLHNVQQRVPRPLLQDALGQSCPEEQCRESQVRQEMFRLQSAVQQNTDLIANIADRLSSVLAPCVPKPGCNQTEPSRELVPLAATIAAEVQRIDAASELLIDLLKRLEV